MSCMIDEEGRRRDLDYIQERTGHPLLEFQPRHDPSTPTPYTFKNATFKPGKRPRLLPRWYRLIALLSCLGKVLERVVARRLVHLALKYKLFSLLHFGATPRRLAVDAAATLIHDVEKTFQDQEVMSALVFDIKLAFDRGTDARLVKKLWEQDILVTMIR